MSDLITSALVRLDADLGTEKHEVIRALAAIVADAGRTSDPDQLATDAITREGTAPTGLAGGIAIPHCRTAAVEEPTLAFVRLQPTVEFGAKDGPADLAFLIAAPAGGDVTHLQLLTKLARALVRADFTAGLRDATTDQEVVDLVLEVVADAPAATPAAAPGPAAAGTGEKSLVAVTACPTGIAHTYMAAEALEAAAAKAGVPIAVETQGSAGSKPLSPATIAAASAVIFAVDVGVRDRGRFAGKPVVSSGVKRPIDDGDAMIAEALRYAEDPNAPRVEGSVVAGESTGGGAGESWGARTRRVLMTGVSYMIPFVAAGGLMIALGFLFGGYEIVGPYGDIAVHNTLFDLPDAGALGLHHVLFGTGFFASGFFAYVGALFFIIGKTAFALFIPALAGYIAYAIADRPGIAPGFILGGLATNLFNVTATNGTALPATGFLGAIAGGVLAGVIAHWIAGWKVPTWARGLMPVMVIPLLTSVIAGLLMIIVLGKPIAWLMDRLNAGLTNMSGSSAVVLGIILGLMMAFDMGGPLNKVAYVFATTGIGAAGLASNAPQLKIMAAVMLAGMVPPIALALATVLRPQLFTVAERENGKAGWLLGASFITEGAIPFAAADPLRVIPSIMIGSAVTGGLSELLGVAVRAPHGGIFVIFAVHNILGYVIALAVGVVVGAFAVVTAKTAWPSDPELATV
ncbi:MAG TPA: fructose-specific PTS transporter subunit EIIC [Nocardioides sp.]|uniref:PTS fructose transporter subunit IIABC n=1 Tax=Nocardioides sp. TaxID=35761 RepID=UPI002E37C551|nr:fructose-specific PTS transporter subunit EIIC [Nocardioides sp.]HEX3930964.1 fructose-specific PTS transporter subunit EIIC [Nocardioides sp.]